MGGKGTAGEAGRRLGISAADSRELSCRAIRGGTHRARKAGRCLSRPDHRSRCGVYTCSTRQLSLKISGSVQGIRSLRMSTRRLAAILAADVVGFSTMMEKDEEGTASHIRAVRREIIEP